MTMSVYRRSVRDYLRTRLGPGVVFLRLECDVDVVVKAAMGRVEEYLKGIGKTLEEWWSGPSQFPGVCFRDKFGEFGFDNFKKMQLEYYLAGMEPFDDDELDGVVVNTTSRDAAVFERINAALGLAQQSCEVDLKELGEMQKARWADWAEDQKKCEKQVKS